MQSAFYRLHSQSASRCLLWWCCLSFSKKDSSFANDVVNFFTAIFANWHLLALKWIATFRIECVDFKQSVFVQRELHSYHFTSLPFVQWNVDTRNETALAEVCGDCLVDLLLLSIYWKHFYNWFLFGWDILSSVSFSKSENFRIVSPFSHIF